jgi:hypothetical protein
MKLVEPTVFITDEVTAASMIERMQLRGSRRQKKGNGPA